MLSSLVDETIKVNVLLKKKKIKTKTRGLVPKTLEQYCPIEFSKRMEMFYIRDVQYCNHQQYVNSEQLKCGYWNQETILNFSPLNLHSCMWLLATILDNPAL